MHVSLNWPTFSDLSSASQKPDFRLVLDSGISSLVLNGTKGLLHMIEISFQRVYPTHDRGRAHSTNPKAGGTSAMMTPVVTLSFGNDETITTLSMSPAQP